MDWGTIIPSIVSVATGLGIVVLVLKKIKRPMKEIAELLMVCNKATDKDSPGGAKITPDELAVIMKEAKDVPSAMAEVFKRMG